jgi:hypothetical protein
MPSRVPVRISTSSVELAATVTTSAGATCNAALTLETPTIDADSRA